MGCLIERHRTIINRSIFLYMDWIPLVIILIIWILSKKLKQRDKEKRI
jgi:hypothetical protein